MGKRKQTNHASDDDNSGSDVSLVDVSFDFFDPNPEVDFHALKKLIDQLFHHDSELINPHALVELVLSQPAVGTTIKTDGKESDPYAILTVLNMNIHQENPSISCLKSYLLQKSLLHHPLHSTLSSLFSTSDNHIGFVLCERLINMPVQCIPPMYNLLSEELSWAIAERNDPFKFSHLIFVSRTYHLTREDEETMNSELVDIPSKKKSKKMKAASAAAASEKRPEDGIYSFHPEDELIKQLSLYSLDYPFTSSSSREKESLGLDVRGRMMLMSIDRFDELVKRMNDIYGQ